MDNQYFIKQKDKYTKKGSGGGDIAASSTGMQSQQSNIAPKASSSGGFDEEKEWLRVKVEELQEELMRRTQTIQKLKGK